MRAELAVEDISEFLKGTFLEGAPKALERVLRKLGQKKVQSGKYTMVVDPMNSSRLLSPMISALNGSALQQKNSFLLNKLNEKIASDRLTLTDEPHLVKASGARYFDNEGIATERRSIFDKGVLNTYFIDTHRSTRMGNVVIAGTTAASKPSPVWTVFLSWHSCVSINP